MDASAKLAFLRTMLPKLKAKGHRVLIFSQFVIALNLLEDFLVGQGYKYLRLDGTTAQDIRQKDIDKFNAPDSDYFVYMLSTRAGGVGINLASADTVIIADLDFNPHMDTQAIARAHRFGQKKKVLVFRLMMKQTVEETIMQIGKKKLMLDHLIVQTMQKDDDEDFTSILLNGARAVFDDNDDSDIKYDDDAIEAMITELESREEAKQKTAGFTFAPIYDFKNKQFTELEEEAENLDGAADFWKDVLERANADRAKAEQEMYGRGIRRAAQVANGKWERDLDPASNLSKAKPKEGSEASEYSASNAGGESDVEDEGVGDPEDLSGLGVTDPGGIIKGQHGHKRQKGTNGQVVIGKSHLQPPGDQLAGPLSVQAMQGKKARPPRGRPIQPLQNAMPLIHPLIPEETKHLYNSLGKIQAYRSKGAHFHAAKCLVALFHEVCSRTQVKGHYQMLPNLLDQAVPAAKRAKKYKLLAQRVDGMLVLYGAQPIFATDSGLAVAAYLFSPDGYSLYDEEAAIHAQNGRVAVAGPSHPQMQDQQYAVQPLKPSSNHGNAGEYNYRTLDLVNGHQSMAVDDDVVAVEYCGFCHGVSSEWV